MELSERKIKILNIAVEEFIKDSAPITSSSVKDRTSLDVSTATLRSELNALEAMGFLKQLHTSGGRVPTAQGYRFYVENLLKNIKATNGELEDVRKLIENRTQSLNEIVAGIAKNSGNGFGISTESGSVCAGAGVYLSGLQDGKTVFVLLSCK